MVAVLLYVLFVVVGLRYFEPAQLGGLLTAAGALWSAAAWRRGSWRDLAVPLGATAVGASVWVLETALIFRLLPVMVSALIFAKFFDAAWRGRPFLAGMLSGIPRLNLPEAKRAYIDRSHGYWAAVTGVNTALQIAMVLAPTGIWALYTTAGWYLLFATALAAQIIYGKLHGV